LHVLRGLAYGVRVKRSAATRFETLDITTRIRWRVSDSVQPRAVCTSCAA